MVSDLQPANATENNLVIHLAFIALAPLLLALCNTEWLYSAPGYIDPWVYLGYAFNYTDPTFHDNYYKISRLPWIIVLFTAHHLLPPTLANHMSHLGVFIVTLIPFYLALRSLVGANGALIATLLLAVYPYAHGSGGWDYHNAIAGAFYAWSYYFLTLGLKQFPEQHSTALFMAGIFIGLLLHTNVFFVLFAPIMLLHSWTLRGGFRRSEISRTLLLIVCGVTAVTIILGLINWSVGRQFLFFRPLLSLLISFARDASQQETWWHPWNVSWTSEALYLSFVLAMVGSSVVALLIQLVCRPNKGKSQDILCSMNLQLILAVAIWVLLQSSGHTFLDYSYFAYPLIFPAFATFGAIVSGNGLDSSRTVSILLTSLFILLLVVPLCFGETILKGATIRYLGIVKWNILHSAALFCLASMLFVVSRRLAVVTIAVALLGIGNVVSMAGAASIYGFHERDCSIRAHVFDAAIQLNDKLRTQSVPISKMVIWHSNEELNALPNCSPITMKDHLVRPFVELVAGFVGSVRPPWEMMPAISAIGGDEFKSWATDRKVLVLVTQNSNAIIEMNDRVRMLGLSAEIGSAGIIDIGQAHFRIDLLSFQ